MSFKRSSAFMFIVRPVGELHCPIIPCGEWILAQLSNTGSRESTTNVTRTPGFTLRLALNCVVALPSEHSFSSWSSMFYRLFFFFCNLSLTCGVLIAETNCCCLLFKGAEGRPLFTLLFRNGHKEAILIIYTLLFSS